MTVPFQYPSTPLQRRHAPRGYERAGSYHPWLRDEFTFRCVFCLTRETWRPDRLEVEHFESVSLKPALALEYSNLFYSCRMCNAKKGDRAIPDPGKALHQGAIRLAEDGRLEGRTPEVRGIIDVLGLNAKRLREHRVLWTAIVELARRKKPALYCQLLGYPDDLPDLSKRRPPGGNSKPDGVHVSHFERRKRGELPEAY